MANIPPVQPKVYPASYRAKAPNPYPIIRSPFNAVISDYQMQRDLPYCMAQLYIGHGGQQPIATEHGFCHFQEIPIGNARKSKPTVAGPNQKRVPLNFFLLDGAHPTFQGFERLRLRSPERHLTGHGVLEWYIEIKALQGESMVAHGMRLQSIGLDNTQVIDLTLSGALRFALNLRTFPACPVDDKFARVCKQFNRGDLASKGRLTISTPGTCIPLQVAGMNQNTIYFHHAGDIRYWTIIPERERDKLERLVLSMCPDVADADRQCPRWVNHLSINVQPDLLDLYGIDFQKVETEKDELLMIFQGCYYMSYSEGVTVVESRYFGGHYWFGNGNDQIKTCVSNSALCQRYGDVLE